MGDDDDIVDVEEGRNVLVIEAGDDGPADATEKGNNACDGNYQSGCGRAWAGCQWETHESSLRGPL